MRTEFRYPDFFEKGGYPGLVDDEYAKCCCSGKPDLLGIEKLRDDVFEYFRNVTAYGYYSVLQAKEPYSKIQVLSALLKDGCDHLFGIERGKFSDYIMDSLDDMEQFALLEYELRERKGKYKDNGVDYLGKN